MISTDEAFLKKTWQKEKRRKKKDRVRITDDIWMLVFRNQTKGPR